jgi:hypothetical protein
MTYVGSWVGTDANVCDVFVRADGQLIVRWDRPPSPAWPPSAIAHWQTVLLPSILRALATAGPSPPGPTR